MEMEEEMEVVVVTGLAHLATSLGLGSVADNPTMRIIFCEVSTSQQGRDPSTCSSHERLGYSGVLRALWWSEDFL